MKVLISAMYCKPNSGSEQAYGWWWATELSTRHDVTVVTGAAQREDIEAAIAADPSLRRVRFVYVPTTGDQSASGTENRFERIGQYIWQLRAMRTVRRLVRTESFDLAHHVTTGTWRQPSCLLASGLPYAMGPMAGSERLPPGFARTFGWRAFVRETIRNTAIAAARLDPLIQLTLRRSRTIVAAGTLTHSEMTHRFPAKVTTLTQVFPHPAIGPGQIGAREWRDGEPLRMSWVGRLVPSKGLPILLRAMADSRLAGSTVDVMGTGPELESLQTLATDLGLEDRVNFCGHVGQEELFDRIRSSHLFVFTSLQELMGQALSEAMQLGAGCVVFDWSGGSVLAGDHGAEKISVGRPNEASADLADALVSIVDEGRVGELQDRARKRIDELIGGESPLDRIENLYARVTSARS